MRETVSVFQAGFAVGLRKNTAIANNVECLSECYNMVVEKEGLVPRQEIFEPIVFTPDWPFPILYTLSNRILYFTRRAVYGIDANWEPYLLYSSSAGWGGRPHIADFQNYIIWAAPHGTWYLKDDTVRPFEDWKGETICNFRQQIIMGEAELPKGPERNKDGTINNTTVSIPKEGTVAWGIIGDTEFRFQLGQENGWMQIPFIGKVLNILPMGSVLYVYHQNGIYRLTPTQEPLPTFGTMPFSDIGPLNRDCVAGNSNAHIMLGSDRELYLILPEKALSDQGRSAANLGYKEYMSTLRNPIVVFDGIAGHWWIGDEKRCFIFNGQGLSESSYTPTAIGNFNGSLYACGIRHGEDHAIITTSTNSINSRSIKTLMVVEADIRADAATGQVLWRTDFRKALKESAVKPLDARGFFFPIVSGSELEVRIKTPNFRNTHISRLWLRYKVTDKVSVRGIVNAGAPQNAATD